MHRRGQKRFFIVDVFGEEKYSGNQLAVVELQFPITDSEMQKIAAEFNFPETTFITSISEINNGFEVRIFTPKKEVPFAGHPTLGTAYIIRREIIKRDVHCLNLNLKIGQIPVRFESVNNRLTLWMKQIHPVFGKVSENRAEACAMVGLSGEDIDDRYPIQVVSTGIPFLIFPVKSLKAIKKAKVNLDLYRRYFSGQDETPLFLFCPETYETSNQINCRMFADTFGIPEDPATGSANGCLAGYLLNHQYFGKSDIQIKVEQGFEIGRRSILQLDASIQDNQIEIQIGGQVFDVANGWLN